MLCRMPDDAILDVGELTVHRGGRLVLDRIDLVLRRGQMASLIGPNGAGKSTLLQVVAGLIEPTDGRVDCRARRIGYIPQQAGIDPELPVTVQEFLSLKRSPGGSAEREAVLAEIDAAHLAGRPLGRLSGGEFQRVLMAYALLGDPDLLLLDEPLTGVDYRGGMSFHRLLHHLHDERGLTVLMVSHDLHLVEHMSQTIFCLNREICCHGEPAEVLRPDNLERAYGHPGRPEAA